MNRGTPRAWATSVTPFDSDGRLDGDMLANHLARLGEAPIGVYIGGSGSGEGNMLTRSERREVMSIGRAVLGGKTPVRAMGTEPRSSYDMLEHLADAAAAGLDGAQVYPLDIGHGKRPSDREIERYLRTVLKSAELPVVLVSHRAVGYETPPALLAELAHEFPAVMGVNWTQNRLDSLVELLRVLPQRVEVHTGGLANAVTVLAVGGSGFISTEANVAPRLTAEIVIRFVAGDVTGAGDAYFTALRLGALIDEFGGIAATKALMEQLRLPCGPTPRDPRIALEADRAAALAEAVRALGPEATR